MLISISAPELINEAWNDLGFFLDKAIYGLISFLYNLFNSIASVKLLNSTTLDGLKERMYLIIAVISLFIIIYSLLQIIINPDKGASGEYSTAKVIFNLVKATILILLVPTLFSFAFRFQASVMSKNFIVRLVSGRYTQNGNAGTEFMIPVYEGFFYLNDVGQKNDNAIDLYDLAEKTSRNNQSIEGFSAFFHKNRADEGGTVYDLDSDDHVLRKTVTYWFPISTIAGCFVAYVLLVYCFDIAVRAVKLAFFEVISPFPILISIIPKQDKIFNNWVKNTLKTYFELFLRVFVLSLGIYLISLIPDIVSKVSSSGNMQAMTRTFIILGIVMFIRKAPKLISEIFGIDMKNTNMSLKDRLRDSGITALAGAGLGSAAYVGSTYSALKDRKDIGKWGKFWRGAVRTNPLSTLSHGAKLGFTEGWRNGTLKGVGAAGNYAVYQERAYARGSNWLATNFELLRDDLGFMSYYDRLNNAADIREGSQRRLIDKTLRETQTVYDDFSRQKEKTYGFDEKKRANDRAITKFDSMKSKAEDQAGKQTSKTVASVKRLTTEKAKLDTLSFDVAQDPVTGKMSLIKSVSKKMDADEMRKQLVNLDQANANGLISSKDYSSMKNYYQKRINDYDSQEGYRLSDSYANMNSFQIDTEMKRLDQALASKAITPEQHTAYTEYYTSKKKNLAKQNASDAMLFDTQLRNFNNQGEVLDYIGTDYASTNDNFKAYALKYCFEDYKTANLDSWTKDWLNDHPNDNKDDAERAFDAENKDKFRFVSHKDMSDAITGSMFDGSSRDAKFDIGKTNNLSDLAYQIAIYKSEAGDDSVNLVYNDPENNKDGSSTKVNVKGVDSSFGEDVFKGKDHLVNTNQTIERVKDKVFSESVHLSIPKQLQGIYGKVDTMDEAGRFIEVLKSEQKAVVDREAANKDYIKAMATNKEASENIRKTRNQYTFRANHKK